MFAECEKSEREDGVGIVVRKRKIQGREGWERLSEVLNGEFDAHNGSNKKIKGKQKAFVGTLGDVGGTNGLVDWLERWKTTHLRCTLETRGGEGGKEPREIRIVLRGVMRIVLMLHWNNGTIQVDRVACFGLKEMVGFWYSNIDGVVLTFYLVLGQSQLRPIPIQSLPDIHKSGNGANRTDCDTDWDFWTF